MAEQEKPAEDLAVDLAGILIAPTFLVHKTKKQQMKWFDYWKRQLEKAVKAHIKKAAPLFLLSIFGAELVFSQLLPGF